MKHKYSLVHLTCISSAPPEFIRTAAAAGYDYVSLRTISMQLPNEIPHYLTDPVLREETRAASKETGVQINDTENARIYDGVDVRNCPACALWAAVVYMGSLSCVSSILLSVAALPEKASCPIPAACSGVGTLPTASGQVVPK